VSPIGRFKRVSLGGINGVRRKLGHDARNVVDKSYRTEYPKTYLHRAVIPRTLLMGRKVDRPSNIIGATILLQ
jgi:hypothetical protein